MMMMIIEIIGKVEDSSAYLPLFYVSKPAICGLSEFITNHLQLLHYPRVYYACIEIPL